MDLGNPVDSGTNKDLEPDNAADPIDEIDTCEVNLINKEPVSE